MREFSHGQDGRLEVFGIRPGTHRGAGFAITVRSFAALQGLCHIPVLEHDGRHLAFTVAGGLQPFGQGIGHAHAHAMQTAREAVGAALALVELAAGVQAGEHQLNHRC